ncbi:hypothetical protein STXM2123_4979 [Streptomyces sp. F-3]|nr:hypothetical protein STXM2123_4979 [Streptomyces sp. F-3]
MIARRTTVRSTAAITRINRTLRPIASHVDQFSSTQLAAFVALSCASWSVGTVRAGVSDGEGDGEEPAAGRTAGKDTAGTSRCIHPPARNRCRRGHEEVTGRAEPPH